MMKSSSNAADREVAASVRDCVKGDRRAKRFSCFITFLMGL